jgi:hypothetical protein
MTEKCKHCDRCKGGCLDVCKCCGKCQNCGGESPLFAPGTLTAPFPWPVPMVPEPGPLPSDWPWPGITYGDPTTVPQPLRLGETRITCGGSLPPDTFAVGIQ